MVRLNARAIIQNECYSRGTISFVPSSLPALPPSPSLTLFARKVIFLKSSTPFSI